MAIENKHLVLIIVISSVLSAAGTAALLAVGKPEQTPSPTTASNGLAERVAALEAQLAEQQSLLDTKPQSVAPLSQETIAVTSLPQTSVEQAATQVEQQTPDVEAIIQQQREELLAQLQPGYRQQQLVAAGFAQEEAARIIQLESAESLRQLDAQYKARRQRLQQQGGTLASTNPLRAELGDENYERYLKANGWPTSASIGTVIGGSPGASAGLKAGDNILSYAGQRVFNLNDVTFLTAQGEVGENVLIEVERDGEPVQLTIPRGPIGVRGGRFGR